MANFLSKIASTRKVKTARGIWCSPALHFYGIRCKCFPSRRCHGKQTTLAVDGWAVTRRKGMGGLQPRGPALSHPRCTKLTDQLSHKWK